MTTVAKPPTTTDPIDAALSDRITPDDDVVEAIADHRRRAAAYRGGLPAERRSWQEQMRPRSRRAIRAAYLAGVGRKIDLIALLRQRDKRGRPIWTIAAPEQTIDQYNGMVEGDGDVCIHQAGRGHGVYLRIETGRPLSGGNHFQPAGIPALPPRAREIATAPAVRKRAKWIGVLYQPDTWTEIDPCPAIVVEWRDRPGEYYCLAVWGDDRPAIMEFVD